MHSKFKLGGPDSIFNANSIFPIVWVTAFLQKRADMYINRN